MKVSVRGIGAWGPGFANGRDLQRVLAGETVECADNPAPKPGVIPANERRRAPLAVRLAVEVCTQAVADADMSAGELACIFSSGLGDTDLTDYMCRELAGENKQLSPTKFHNSVHNAAAGYWTIATACQQSANSVAGLEHSVSVALLEAICQCQTEQIPVILAFYDIPTCTVLSELFANRHAFACALVLSPGNEAADANGLHCQLSANPDPQWPQLALPPALADCYLHNPAARVLPLLLALTGRGNTSLDLPLSSESSLKISVTGPL